MRKPSQSIKRIFCPRISRELQREIDKGNVRNMYLLSTIVLCVELIMLLIYIVTNLAGFGDAELYSALRVSFCVLVCAVAMVVSTHMRRKEDYRYWLVTLVDVLGFLVLTGWSVFAAYFQAARGEQYLTFYAVMVGFLCFISFRPILACILTAAAYAGLWIMLRCMGGGQELNIFNYAVMAILTAVGMIIRYDQQIKVSRSVLELQELNRSLSHASRHDALTGLYNREALSEDRKLLYGVPITVVLADIDYFKNVNDIHGHSVGDRALREAGMLLRESFPGSMVYRYGGDEFLMMFRSLETPAQAQAAEDSLSFDLPIRSGSLEIRLSLGTAEGVVHEDAEFVALISQADSRLYEVKRRVHAEDDPRDRRDYRE